MNRSRLLMIGGLALAVGLLVSFTVYNKLRIFAGTNNEARGVPVVVAADDILVGARLEAHDARVITLPQTAIPPGAFSVMSSVLGRGAILPISKGDFILPSKLAAMNAGAGLPSMIPQGMRAVSVRVNDVVSVAGFVQPGTHVDVLATGNEGSGNERQTTTVLENVLVLAVGKSLDRSATADAQTAPVITLAVSPDDAQKLALVSQEGRIQLSLRNPVDTKKGGIAATRTSSVYPGATPVAPAESKPKLHKVVKKAPAPAAAPTPYQVEIIHGNKREENKFEPPPQTPQ
ncbi:MAG TPA: Flp pilus assembly protein CpaB [Terriglobales bacterium]|jgi:pilus assembly protein CpaB|nr:Flp pilus assembly protein CpaB [Terriglobales bacterium]